MNGFIDLIKSITYIILMLEVLACGRYDSENSLAKAIIGNDEREITQDSHVGILYRKNADEFASAICSAFGSDERQVLTAAHCIVEDVSEYFVKFGRKSISIDSLEKFEKADVVRLTMTESLQGENILPLNDQDPVSSSLDDVSLIGLDPASSSMFKSSVGILKPATRLDGTAMNGLYFHTLDTVPGSSGAPILKDGKVVAMHLASQAAAHGNDIEPFNIAVSIAAIESANTLDLYSQKIVQVEGLPENLMEAYKFAKDVFPDAMKKLEAVLIDLTPEAWRILGKGVMKAGGWGLAIGEMFDKVPVHGDKLERIENPLKSGNARNVIQYTSFRLGNNNFDSTQECYDTLLATQDITNSHAHVFVKFSDPSLAAGQDIPKPIRYKVRFKGICGLQSDAKIRTLKRVGDSTYGVENQATIRAGSGYAEFEFQTTYDAVAIEISAGTDPGTGDLDDFFILNLQVEAVPGLDVRPESARTCKTQLFNSPEYLNKCFGQDNEFPESGWWFSPSTRPLTLCKEPVKSMNNSCRLPTTVCDVEGKCAYSPSGEISNFDALGLKKIDKFRVCSKAVECLQGYGIADCKQLVNGCPESLKGEPAQGEKVSAETVTVIEAKTMLVSASFLALFKEQYGRNPEPYEFEQMVIDLGNGVDDMSLMLGSAGSWIEVINGIVRGDAVKK